MIWKWLLLPLLVWTVPAVAALRVPIYFNLPDGLGNYDGPQPVTFGLPFPEGELAANPVLRLVDEQGRPQLGQFQVTATWKPDGRHVRWLLIDAMAAVRQGKAAPLYLETSPQDATAPASPLRVWTEGEGANRVVRIETGVRTYVFRQGGGDLGVFELRDGDGRIYRSDSQASQWKLEVEQEGPVRAVVKITGQYADERGRSIAAFVTRVRLYANCPFARIYHTLNWLTDDSTAIGELAWLPSALSGPMQVGMDGKGVALAPAEALRQVTWEEVRAGDGVLRGKQLDGWMRSGPHGEFFAALRWPWQQYPVGFATGADDGSSSPSAARLLLLGPAKVLSLKPLDVAVPPVLLNVPAWNLRIFRGNVPGNDVAFNGPPALPHLTPRGLAKTWEILLWPGQPEISAETKNLLTQHPVFGYGDPAFAVRAELPSPASPYDPRNFPEVEKALQDAFDWYTREDGRAGDFGVFNYGDLQWSWTSTRGHAIYRYWMNNGKGWSIVPWALFLRSGDRRYWENGEANSRHVMDIDACHLPDWPRDPKDFRLKGGQYHYSAIHWGYGPEVFTYYVDSEYLPCAWYLTGYERARDMMWEHAEAVARFKQRQQWMDHFRADLKHNAGRHLYVMVKNLTVLYEATWDQRLRQMAEECLDLTLASQFENGNFPHVKTNHYLDQPLNIAARVFGWEKVGPALKKWHDFLGDPLRPGPYGNVEGPMSLWSAVNLYRHSGEKHYLDVAGRVMRTRAAGVVRGPDTWRGLNPVQAHEAGPALRDWPIVMAELGKIPPEQRPDGYLPMAGLHGLLPGEAGWGRRHVALTLKEENRPLTLQVYFQAGLAEYRLRLLAPDGSVVQTVQQTSAPRTLAYEPLAAAIAAPADAPRGVYVLEIDSRSEKGEPTFTAPVHVFSSSGKLVHLMPPGERNFCGSQYVGQIVVEPSGNEPVSLSPLLGRWVVGRTLLLDEKDKVLAAGDVGGSASPPPAKSPADTAPALPTGEPTGASVRIGTLVSFIVPNMDKPQHTYTLRGNRPFLATSREAWFDPTKYPCPDLSRYTEKNTHESPRTAAKGNK